MVRMSFYPLRNPLLCKHRTPHIVVHNPLHPFRLVNQVPVQALLGQSFIGNGPPENAVKTGGS